MSHGLLYGADQHVIKWCFDWQEWKLLKPMRFDGALGLVGPDKTLKGAVLLHGYNGNDIHISYFGANTLSPGIVRSIFQYIIAEFDPARVTVVVSKRNKRLIRSCQRFGFRLEGAQRCYYGKVDCIRNTGVRMVAFREQIERWAKLPNTHDKVAYS